MQKGSVDVLKNLRQARSRLDKTIKFLEKQERSERKAAIKRQNDQHDKELADQHETVTTQRSEQEQISSKLQEAERQNQSR